jgi:hypothetical protein
VIKKYLQEPLLHFLVLGGFIFLFYAAVNNGFTEEEKKIIISQAKIDQLTYIWQKKHMRKPTKEERQKMIDGEIYAEVMSREAVKLGLDKEDGIIRRRLVQKMSFVSANFSALLEPSDTELKKYLESHQQEFMSERQISFILKNRVILEKSYTNMSEWEVSRSYGRAFTEKLFTLAVGVWSKNIDTAYGKVDVLVSDKKQASTPLYATLKNRLKSVWQKEAQRKFEKRFYETLKKEYSITVGE